MGLQLLKYFNSFSAGTDFRRQYLTSVTTLKGLTLSLRRHHNSTVTFCLATSPQTIEMPGGTF